MGAGAPRGLEIPTEVRDLNPALSERLGKALKVMDKADPEFAETRVDENYSQLSKRWSDFVAQMDAYLRTVARSMLMQHQLSCETGSEGGGTKSTPFIEESGFRFTKLSFGLKHPDGRGADILQARWGDTVLTEKSLSEVDYEWVEKVVIAWVVKECEKRG